MNTLLIAGYSFVSLGKKKFETANGVIEADMILMHSFIIWDKVFEEINIFTIDFIEDGIISPYEGVLGLDIMRYFVIKIDFIKSQLYIE